MMISDGLGPASVSFARTYYQYINKQAYDYELPLDTIHVGQSRTRSSSTLVTDSAAGATAFSCGLKTYNGGVGVDPHGKPCGTVLESAKHHRKMLTGLVATSRISHATPASFSSHVKDRDNENAIAVQQIGDTPLGRSVDLMFGGGYCHYLPKSDPQGCRQDERHLFKEAQNSKNWTTVQHGDRRHWDQVPTDDPSVLPIISLFTSGHMSYEIDRDHAKEPSLTEMSDKALRLLAAGTQDSEQGFFLMIEGSRIDMAAHSNDPAAHLYDILEYQNTVALVKSFVDQHPDTIMISTSDHETGGLSLARQVSAKYPKYLWYNLFPRLPHKKMILNLFYFDRYPDVLKNVKRSTALLAAQVLKQTSDQNKQKLVADQLGIQDMTKDEMKTLSGITKVKRMDQYLAEMVSLRSQLGWATHGHSGVDVNLYAYGKYIDELRGSHENVDIGHIISKKLNLDLDAITHQLNKHDSSFHLTPITQSVKVEYTDHLDQYHHNEGLLHHPTLI
ncbi:alkaline-phosphatase-like protein [Absidia repens]|uniref:Alkaline phosphatase n=1 Tax=Absidia repens TaxID=90262 RepID=A0A1X2J2P8_9FUNG|nr:alkaline-phosphatase-like protein [Absidia repens]